MSIPSTMMMAMFYTALAALIALWVFKIFEPKVSCEPRMTTG
jgi:hypothetical protein